MCPQTKLSCEALASRVVVRRIVAEVADGSRPPELAVYKKDGGGPEPLPDVKTNRHHEAGEFVSQQTCFHGLY